MAPDMTSVTPTSGREGSGSTSHADEAEAVVVPEVTPAATATSGVVEGSGCVVPGSGSAGCNCFIVMFLCKSLYSAFDFCKYFLSMFSFGYCMINHMVLICFRCMLATRIPISRFFASLFSLLRIY